MKTKVIDYKKIVDVNTFQPKVRVTLEWLLEDLQDAKIGRPNRWRKILQETYHD